MEAEEKNTLETKSPEKMFQNVHYYLIGSISEEAVEMLERGGAHEENYLIDQVTHVITEETDHTEISEAQDIFELPVVSPKWIEMSLKCGRLLPCKPFTPTEALFTNVIACCTQVSAKDRNALWAMITFRGGRCVSHFTSKCTHLIAGRPNGAKYKCALYHDNKVNRVKVVSPDWVRDCFQSNRWLEEGRYHPRYLLTQEDLDEREKERQRELQAAKEEEKDADIEEVKKQTPKVQYKVKVPWAEDITPMPDLPLPEEVAIPAATPPASLVSTPPRAHSSSSTTPKDGDSSSKKKDKKHKKKKKKKKHKKNKEKEKRKEKKRGRDSGHSTPRSDISSVNEGGGSEKGGSNSSSRSMLRNITNNSDFIPNLSGAGGKRHISQVLNAIAGKTPQRGKSSGPHFGVIPSIPTIQYYGHDPSTNLKPDQCLLGCIFLIIEYLHLVNRDFIDIWTKVIQQHGGMVDDCYSDRITHILCDTQRTEIFQLAKKDGKRCITASWLNDCLACKLMKPPWRALHFPPPCFPLNIPMCKEYVIAVTGFEGTERNDVKTMIEMIGATYTGYLSRGNTLLICRRPEGFKYEKAQEWRMPTVNVRWLSDIILGKFGAFQNLLEDRYQLYEGEDPFKIEYDIPLPLMAPWTSPLKISSATKRSFMAHLSSKRKAENMSPGAAKRAKKSHSFEDELWDTPVPALDPHKIPKVMFTGIDGQFIPDLSKKLEKLGGRVVHDIQKCTHLVTTKVIRTVKFLCGVCCSRHIISPMWIEESYKSRWFLEHGAVHDGQRPASVLDAERDSEMRRGYPPGETAPLSQIREVHKAAGKHSFIVISCDVDMPQCREFVRSNIDIYSVEFILTSVLRQKLDFNSYPFLRVCS
ncbi:putative PAX-interacting protein 1 [Apostichopus japonicus]|uniref:PAX-interacting protein 1 n=1 Tax=Stichopus japonicus TaxID=307972 RepID=A0A2G8LC24_STIJA|nr:putative PAX-interacting protein 1 [Apostichopus japonicus]